MTLKDLKQYTPFFFYIPITFGMFAAAASHETGSLLRIALWVVAGFLSWGFVEYLLHRFIFHYPARTRRGQTFVYRMHLEHHDFPNDAEKLFASLRMSLPIAVIYCLIAWGTSADWRVVSYLFFGLVAGYTSYEWLHYQAHHRTPKGRLFRYLRTYHMLHHFKTPQRRFGVTSPLFDLLFGTFLPARKLS